jgi:hypothetical protein
MSNGTYGHFKRNESRESDGIILDMGTAGRFTIARAGGGNKRYQQSLERRMRPHRKSFQQGTLSDDIAGGIILESFVDAVILGWDGVTDEEGKSIAFSKEAVRKLLTDLPDLFTMLREAASDASLFRDAEQREADSGN